VQKYLPSGTRRGRARTHPLRDTLDAICSVVRTGCAWRYLPANFPPWSVSQPSPTGPPVPGRPWHGAQEKRAATGLGGGSFGGYDPRVTSCLLAFPCVSCPLGSDGQTSRASGMCAWLADAWGPSLRALPAHLPHPIQHPERNAPDEHIRAHRFPSFLLVLTWCLGHVSLYPQHTPERERECHDSITGRLLLYDAAQGTAQLTCGLCSKCGRRQCCGWCTWRAPRAEKSRAQTRSPQLRGGSRAGGCARSGALRAGTAGWRALSQRLRVRDRWAAAKATAERVGKAGDASAATLLEWDRAREERVQARGTAVHAVWHPMDRQAGARGAGAPGQWAGHGRWPNCQHKGEREYGHEGEQDPAHGRNAFRWVDETRGCLTHEQPENRIAGVSRPRSRRNRSGLAQQVTLAQDVGFCPRSRRVDGALSRRVSGGILGLDSPRSARRLAEANGDSTLEEAEPDEGEHRQWRS
jgi:hypothetical protein